MRTTDDSSNEGPFEEMPQLDGVMVSAKISPLCKARGIQEMKMTKRMKMMMKVK